MASGTANLGPIPSPDPLFLHDPLAAVAMTCRDPVFQTFPKGFRRGMNNSRSKVTRRQSLHPRCKGHGTSSGKLHRTSSFFKAPSTTRHKDKKGIDSLKWEIHQSRALNNGDSCRIIPLLVVGKHSCRPFKILGELHESGQKSRGLDRRKNGTHRWILHSWTNSTVSY